MKHLIIFLSLGLFLIVNQESKAQLSAWQHKIPIKISNNQNVAKSNYSHLLLIDTQSLVGDNKMATDGKDIRIAMDCEGNAVIPHFLESGINTTNTKLWCLLPEIPAASDTVIYLFYGNAGAADVSDFDATFPNQLLIETTDTLTGLIADSVWEYNYIKIAEDVLVKFDPTLSLPWQLRLTASKIEISGTLNGAGFGYPGTIYGDGQGPGGGTMEITGGGGGAYGGDGGDGSYGSNQTSAGVGGTAYGTASGRDIEPGSGGGAAGLVGGGNPGAPGGIKYVIRCQDLTVNGKLIADGLPGLSTQASYSPGGGAGGGILIETRFISGTGTITAKGGRGGDSDRIYYAGGGAGGGRIKVFYSESNNFTGNLKVDGGRAGIGGITEAQDGMSGTIHNAQDTFKIATEILDNSFGIDLISTIRCAEQDITLSATPGASNYNFKVEGASVQNGSSNLLTVKLPEGRYAITATVTVGTCTLETDPYELSVNPNPTPSFGFMVTTVGFCDGDSLLALPIVESGSTIAWIHNQTDTTYTQQDFYIKEGGAYQLHEINANGCTGTSLGQTVEVFPTPENEINLLDTTYCTGDSIRFFEPNGLEVIWERAGSVLAHKNELWISSPGKYAATVVTPKGCLSEKRFFNVAELPVPNAILENKTGPFVCKGVNAQLSLLGTESTDSIVWLYNGVEIPNENSTDLFPGAPGTYSATVYNELGCSSTTVLETLGEFAQPQFDIDGSLSICEGESREFLVNLPPESTFKWVLSNGPNNSVDSLIKIGYSTEIYLVAYNAFGCSDTSNTEELRVNETPEATLDLSNTDTELCEGESTTITSSSTGFFKWYKNGSPFNETDLVLQISDAGYYAIEISNAAGCSNLSDSVVINVNPNPVQPSITQSGDTLFANPAGVLHTWYKDGNVIAGATQSFFLPDTNGTYTVISENQFNCLSEESEPFNFSPTTGIKRKEAFTFELYPNPNNGAFTITAELAFSIQVLDMTGKAIYADAKNTLKKEIELSVAPGLYTVLVMDGKGNSIAKQVVLR
ncbi:DUF2341 domain-containing protein [Luteibaculum oceani]|uniref:DUF2341 domain-containing protein n=1 Tax=Luteibaculum oceani TaxID=1294296 RepID=A0A5C6VA40_9FLAO|nr:DUF2341 domain-containing protein [Luteibaculum oceani]TXC82107.1 DUF2341 domain-containing protein [Luteibaculum oceani]